MLCKINLHFCTIEIMKTYFSKNFKMWHFNTFSLEVVGSSSPPPPMFLFGTFYFSRGFVFSPYSSWKTCFNFLSVFFNVPPFIAVIAFLNVIIYLFVHFMYKCTKLYICKYFVPRHCFMNVSFNFPLYIFHVITIGYI